MQPMTLFAIDVPPISYVHVSNLVIERQTFAKERQLKVDRKMHRRYPPCSCNISHAGSSKPFPLTPAYSAISALALILGMQI